MKNRFSAKPAKVKNPALQRVVDGLRIIQAILLLEKQKPDLERSRFLVFAAQETAEVLLRRLDELKR